MNRQSWTTEQDQAIKTLVQEHGVLDWTRISEMLKEKYNIRKRTGKQCRQRWYNHLNPQVNKKPWTLEQQTLLFEIHRKSGNRWKLMSNYFQGRTDNDIKNHFYSTLRRSLRRLNKFIGEKNSTTQMREIKPSVLSTIMNYIYQQEEGGQNNIMESLKDLPYLIFEFSNFKPIRGKSKIEDDQIVKKKINFIFCLITSFNQSYHKLKQHYKNLKSKKTNLQQASQKSLKFNSDEIQKSDFVKYLPKKTYSYSDLDKNSRQASPVKKNKEKPKQQKRTSENLIKCQPESYEKKQVQCTNLMDDQENHAGFFIKATQENSQNQSNNSKIQEPLPQINGLRTRRISLEAQEDFMDDESIGDIQQPSRISGFYCNGEGLDGLIVVGKQMHLEQRLYTNMEQCQSPNNQEIDQFIEINYSKSEV